jgi:hypothetical protein
VVEICRLAVQLVSHPLPISNVKNVVVACSQLNLTFTR